MEQIHNLWMQEYTCTDGTVLPSGILTLDQMDAVDMAIKYMAIELIWG